ncbi:LPS O-antigen chain length determinant protein WzzB [Enterobacteriaceae bacterium H20N1]|uniref:Chain length determinant protein n=1 Tax=Dryocola boscaweniae TaxID=2925397 RepID=A0A9X2W7T3_9ENTR|nr:LPS O-antigen chain length determinant protein WzzB [Dryocola boscaweniae]MCT4702596.1 LPS O-antigen chain length determinant protein WzzB [Dryocola boscaweniae]MCT4719764.1 LPS O-antigen chain length determinant protein WzzB [Dryocola boscaweniae]
MSQNDNNVVSRSSDPEQIDFIDLIMQLWRGKWTIIAFVIVAIVLAGAYLLVSKEKWTSTAVITQPDAAQIATYNNALNAIYGNSAPNITDVQNRVVGRLSSSMSALSETLANLEAPETLTIEPSVKGQQLPLKISYVSDTPENAQAKVAQYLQQVDEQVGAELGVDLNDSIKMQITTLEDSLKTQEKVAQEQKDLRIKQISEALKFATEAKVASPQLQQTSDVTQDTMFLLGSEALSSMIKNEATRPLVFSPAYYQTKQNLFDIQNLKIDPKTIHAYRYVMKPTLPLRRDSPKKGITLILATLLGGMIGAGVVLGRNAIRNYKTVA